MTLWLCRAGKRGKWEQSFLDENRIYLTWEGLNRNLSELQTKPELGEVLREVYPDAPKRRISQNTGQIWVFAQRMQIGDWVVLPSKMKPAIHIGEITSEYQFNANAVDPCFHYRNIKWIETDIPRTNFDSDLLYSFGALLTICEIKRNDADKRIRGMAKNNWKASNLPPIISPNDDNNDDNNVEVKTNAPTIDLEQVARDHIAKVITRKFMGHGLAWLVDEVLKAQGYTTFLSPEGPDKGIDILAALGPLGFGQPRIAVQVKSGDSAIDRPTLDQLIGTMQNVQADQGLLVSWGGFKRSVDREKATQFFRVRLWDQDTLIDQILLNYDKLSKDLKSKIPLKRIWTIAEPNNETDEE